MTGVAARGPEGLEEISARAVILACGGFEANPEWRTRYLGPGWELARVRGTRMSRPRDLADWLAYLETLHPKAIALGLDRVRAVLARLDAPIRCPVVTVTGTNGKGSTSAMIEAAMRCAGYRTGLYTSPHLLRYNERVRVAGVEASDEALVGALNAVEDARTANAPAVPLTYFEFGTLAALHLFSRSALDVLVLEVGLGGRLDAVNVVDAENRLIGIVTDGDLRRTIERTAPENLANLSAAQMMTQNPVTANPETLAFDALNTMENRPMQISVLPVVDAAGAAVGLLRLHDIVRSGL